MIQTISLALRALVVLTLLTGVVYPLVITGIAQAIFPAQANGSLVEVDGVVIGSELVGQQTEDERYFWWRPSAVNYMLGSNASNLGSSGATNFGPTSAAMAAQVAERREWLRAVNGLPETMPVPRDLLFASGSGLDPHISPDAAYIQVNRVAAARGLATEPVAALVEQAVEWPQLGFLGEPRVNVLRLNLALDALQ
ncbi:MAG: potassium-transporting ATPase subunit C [Anaerolineaceae bacterium]|nr:potassium-transporting ATPase subunit C [Anaerolineaceae bacterium]